METPKPTEYALLPDEHIYGEETVNADQLFQNLMDGLNDYAAYERGEKTLRVTEITDDRSITLDTADQDADAPEATVIEYAVLFEKGPRHWAAYVPDLPGCIAMGETLEAAARNIKTTIELYIETLRADGKPVPEPISRAAHVAVAA